MSAHRVKNLSGFFLDYLNHTIHTLFKNYLRKIAHNFSAIVCIHCNLDGPTWELCLVPHSYITKPRPAFKSDGATLLIKPGNTISIRALFFIRDIFRVGVSHHRNLITQAIKKIPRPWQRASFNRVGASLLIKRVPPTAINRIHQGRASKTIRAISKLFYAMLDRYSKMLVTTQMNGPGLTNKL